FGAQRAGTITHGQPKAPAEPADSWAAKARVILDAAGARDGYCIAWGVGSGRLITELVRQSSLHVIAVERDPRTIREFREKMSAAGLYGERVVVHQGDPLTFALPPYLASLMVAEDLQAAGVEPGGAFVRKTFAALRPYGGALCLPLENGKREDFTRAV